MKQPNFSFDRTCRDGLFNEDSKLKFRLSIMKMFKYKNEEKCVYSVGKVNNGERKRDRSEESQETSSSIRHVIIIMMGQAILHSSWWLEHERRMKGSNFPPTRFLAPFSRLIIINFSFSHFFWISHFIGSSKSSSCSFHKLFIYAGTLSPRSRSPIHHLQFFPCNIENIDRFLWDYLCFSISWLTMCSPHSFSQAHTTPTYSSREKIMKFVEVNFFLLLVFWLRYIFNLSPLDLNLLWVCALLLLHSFVQSSAEIIYEETTMRKFRASPPSLPRHILSIHTFKLCIANMNNFSWLNEKVMPSLESFTSSSSSRVLRCCCCVKFNAFSMPLKSTISHDTRIMKIYVPSREFIFILLPRLYPPLRAWHCMHTQHVKAAKSCRRLLLRRDENKIIQILGEENLIICITTS